MFARWRFVSSNNNNYCGRDSLQSTFSIVIALATGEQLCRNRLIGDVRLIKNNLIEKEAATSQRL